MTAPEPEPPPAPRFWNGPRTAFAVAALLVLQAALAVLSLVPENATVDEVIHLPAGVTYWQTGSFRLYRHNPPLVKLIAALPVVAARPVVDYSSRSWKVDPPDKAGFAHEFMEQNADRYFELFTRGRLLMPAFAVLGGLVVFAWSRSLYGNAAGLLSLALWAFCPNVLAHTRLVTTDLGATSIGALATFGFWRYLRQPTWRGAALAGVLLGLAQATKFSLLLLVALWPLLAAVRLATDAGFRSAWRRIAGHVAVVLVLSVLTLDAVYLFEGVGTALGDYEFTCATLTRPGPSTPAAMMNPDPLRANAARFRVNRFRGGLLGRLPVPLPVHYVLGFDDQKLEAEGVPRKFFQPELNGQAGDEVLGYPVYLDGELRQTSWWYYYLLTLVYKVPEGTWLLVLGSLGVLAASPRSRAGWFDEFAVLAVPAVVLFVMSVFTNINLGLRYVLPIFPFAYVAAGKLARWATGLRTARGRRFATAGLAAALGLTALATARVHPHYLAYFNDVSGGPARGAGHLIDSNIDWGQDLVGLRRWLAANAPGERVGLAYFGQINPRVFEKRGEGFDWFLPPPAPGTMNPPPPRYQLVGPEGMRLQPGLYAVSVSLVKGLPWRVYDTPFMGAGQKWLGWSAWTDAFGYFRRFRPVARVGESIWVYRLSADDVARVADVWTSAGGGRRP